MKKILVTTLTLSLAVVSGLDARQMRRTPVRGRSMSQPVTKQEVARAINADATALQNVNVPKVEKKEAANSLLTLLEANPNEAELAQLYVQRKQKMNEVQAKKDAIKAMNVGWFDFNNVDYKTAKGELGTLAAELKDINQKITAQEKVVGRESSNAVRNAVGGLVVVMGIVALDQYFFGGQGREYLTTKSREFATAASGYAGSAYDTVSGAAASGYNKASGAVNRALGRTPVIAPE